MHSMRISETRPEKKKKREREREREGGRESGVGEKEPSLTSLSNN